MADEDGPRPDREIIEAHLEALFGSPGDLHDGVIEIAHGKDGPARASLFTIDELADASEYAVKVNAAGEQVYVGAALRKPGYSGHKSKLTGWHTNRAEREHIYGSPHAWADADDRAHVDAAILAYRARKCPPDLIVMTGTVPEHRAQFWWRYEQPITDLDRLEAHLAGIAHALGTDAVVDAPRVMRLAGTINWPRKPGRVAELVTMRWRGAEESHTDAIAAWYAYPPPNGSSDAGGQPGAHGGPSRTITGRLDLVAAVAEANLPGKWHHTVRGIVAHLAGLGRSDDEIMLLCRAFTTAGYSIRQTDADVAILIKGARAKGWAPDETRVEPVRELPKQQPARPADIPCLPERLIPAPFLPYVLERCEAMQVPAEYVAVPMLVAAGNTAAGRIAVRPRKADWLVTPNLWGAIVGPPGALKSPAIHAALKPLRRVEAEAWRIFAAEREQWEQAGKNGPPPVPRRFVTNDATEAKLADLLAHNPNGIMLVRDELKGWLNHMANPARSAERQFFLEAWNGLSPYVQDRVGRGTVRVERLCVGILGGLQPDVFQREFLDRAGETGNDGLIQRFQLLIWPDLPAEWRDVDRWPDKVNLDAVFRVFDRIADLDPATVGEKHDHDPCPWVTFAPAAQEVFSHFLASVERRVRGGKLAQFLDGHIAKYRSLMPAIALTLHLIEQPVRIGPTQVGEKHARMALEWCEHLRKVAARIYAMPSIRRDAATQAAADAVAAGRAASVAGRSDGSFTARDVAKLRLPGIGDNQAAVQEALDALVEDGAISVSERRGKGRGGSFRFYKQV